MNGNRNPSRGRLKKEWRSVLVWLDPRTCWRLEAAVRLWRTAWIKTPTPPVVVKDLPQAENSAWCEGQIPTPWIHSCWKTTRKNSWSASVEWKKSWILGSPKEECVVSGCTFHTYLSAVSNSNISPHLFNWSSERPLVLCRTLHSPSQHKFIFEWAISFCILKKKEKKKKDYHIFLCILTAHCSGFPSRSFPYWVTMQWYNFCSKQMKLYRVPFTLLQSRWTRSSQTAPTLPEERLVKWWVDRRHCCHRSWQHQNQQSHSTHTKTLDCWQIPAGPKKVPGTVFKSGSDLWLQFTENTVDGGEGTGDTTRPQLKGFHQLPRCLEGVWGCAAIYRFS